MWTVTETSDGYTITDHNGTERAQLSGKTISTADVKEVMYDRAAELKSQLEDYNGARPVPVGDIIEWMTIIGDMAGEQIELPDADRYAR